MAVYTQLSEAQVAQFIGPFGFPRLLALKATDSGIENTNYFVSAENGQGEIHKLVLTLFEKVQEDELPYFVELTSFLKHNGLPVPAPYRDHKGVAIHGLAGKPAIVVPCFDGRHPDTPNTAQCAAIATAMARMHIVSPQFQLHRNNDRGSSWRERALHRLQPLLSAEHRQLLTEQVNDWRRQQAALDALPCGINHHDLFHDNALFEADQLTGIIDFYNACDDVFIYDLAVLVNDWCSHGDGSIDTARYQAVLGSYQVIRPLTPAETQMWPRILCYAALRFWISRLLSWHEPGSHTKVAQKDPEPMRRMLLQRLTHPISADVTT